MKSKPTHRRGPQPRSRQAGASRVSPSKPASPRPAKTVSSRSVRRAAAPPAPAVRRLAVTKPRTGSVSARLRVSASSPQDVPFDPTQPQDGALIVAEVLRDQFNALQAEILERATEAAFEAAVAALNNAIAQRPEYSWVIDAVNNATASAIANALAQSSNNSNQVTTFDEAAYSYYDQGQMERFIAKLNELINALRR